MPNKFIKSEIWQDPWFMALAPDHKLFYIYCFTSCDHAGILILNPPLAEFLTKIKGLSKGIDSLMKVYNDKIIQITDDKYFIKNYIQYNYPNGLINNNHKAAVSALNILKKFNLINEKDGSLSIGLLNPIDSIHNKEKEKDIDKDIDKDNEKKKENLPFRGPEFKNTWDLWILFRREHKYPVYKPIGLKQTFTKLVNDSGDNVDTAIEMIKKSMAGPYQGIFPLNGNAARPKDDKYKGLRDE